MARLFVAGLGIATEGATQIHLRKSIKTPVAGRRGVDFHARIFTFSTSVYKYYLSFFVYTPLVKTLKLTIPGAPTNWNASSYMDKTHPLLKEWKVVVNTPLKKADAWFVCEDLESDQDNCEIPKGMLLLGSAETSYNSDWIISNQEVMSFYLQFDFVYTFNSFNTENSTASIPFLPWMSHANHGPSIFSQPSFFKIMHSEPNILGKQKRIALICSDQELTSGHRSRKFFAQNLVQKLGDYVDWYGNGVHKIPTKNEAYAKYQYSVVLENQSRNFVLTEKLGDAFLGLTYPFYWGAPNADVFFNSRGFEQIDIINFDKTISQIENALAEDRFLDSIKHIKENRNRTLYDNNFLHRILGIVADRYQTLGSEVEKSNAQVESISFLRKTFGHSRSKLISKLLFLLRNLDEKLDTNLAPLANEAHVLLMNNPLSRKWRAK
jgi:hypothetical protein